MTELYVTQSILLQLVVEQDDQDSAESGHTWAQNLQLADDSVEARTGFGKERSNSDPESPFVD